MLPEIKYTSKIYISNVPIQWIPKIELYYPDLPQFPIIYIHIKYDNKRVYGFPATISYSVKNDKLCDVELLFLSNVELDKNLTIKNKIKEEIEQRIGLSHKISLKDVLEGCINQEHKIFFSELWKHIERSFGKYIPYGKYYEEVFSIIRFVSAWNPKTGRQSEMRMLYNFLHLFGEKIKIDSDWDYLEFYLLPTYDDIRNSLYKDFNKFKLLIDCLQVIWNDYYIKKFSINDVIISSLEKAFPMKKDDFIKQISYPLYKKDKLTLEQRYSLDDLVDAFNRHAQRAAFFIWSIMTIKEIDYYDWDKNFFIKFYSLSLSNKTRGISPKVVACFLQQGFLNKNVIPIDDWVKTFHEYALGIDNLPLFFNSFDNLGKIERVIWLSSQANKTNMDSFFDLLWCQRYGDNGNNNFREANPLSCYQCKLRQKCPGYNKISECNVYITNENHVDLISESKKVKMNLKDGNININIYNDCEFICLTYDRVPKKIYKKLPKEKKWLLIDEFSGYSMTTQHIESINSITNVNEFISNLPDFFN